MLYLCVCVSLEKICMCAFSLYDSSPPTTSPPKLQLSPPCPNMFFLLLSNNTRCIFQLFIKQCQSFLEAGDAVNYFKITWVIMQRRSEKSRSRGMKRTLAEVDGLRWHGLGPEWQVIETLKRQCQREWSYKGRRAPSPAKHIHPHMHTQPPTKLPTLSTLAS